jgi:hypothetical protein
MNTSLEQYVSALDTRRQTISKPAAPDQGPAQLAFEDAPHAWGIGRWAPIVLIAWLTLDVGLRCLPIHWLQLEPAQVLTRFPGRYAPFMPNTSVEWKSWVGELALMGNLPPTEERQAVRFTTDSIGFRNAYDVSRVAPRILVMEGDSYTYGAALSDNETFPAVLAQELKVGVFNGGRFFADPERLLEIDWLLSRIRRGPMAVVYVLLEGTYLPSLGRQHDQKSYDKLAGAIIGSEMYTPIKDTLRFAHRSFHLWSRISPLEIVSTRWYKTLSNDYILPNTYRQNVIERKLPDGRRFLLDRSHVAQYLNPPGDQVAREAADYFAWFRDQLVARDLNFLVLMVPEAISVYGPWLLKNEKPAQSHIFHRLESELVRRNIGAVNGLSVLSAATPADIASGHLSYYREDHHWTPKGVRVLARAVAEAIRTAGIPVVTSARNSDALQ